MSTAQDRQADTRTAMTDIRLVGIEKTYGQGESACRAVDAVSLDIAAGEFFFLLGPSGCGKTTLLRMIAGLVDPSSGRIWFGNHDVTNLPVHRRDAAMVFQNYALWPHMSVQANVEFAPRMQGMSRSERQVRVRRCLEMVKLGNLGARRPRQLSGGQQQRVALARALAAEPACLLLDEPLSNLDAQLRLQMREQLREIVKSSGTTSVYVTHDQKEALAMADRLAIMRDGRIAQVGTPVELYERPASRFVADFVGEANLVEGKVVAVGADQMTIDTPLGQLLASRQGTFVPGTPVVCGIRPERLVFAGATPRKDAQNLLAGKLISRVYQGETTQCRVELANRAGWKVLTVGAAVTPTSDDAVHLHLPVEAVMVMASSGLFQETAAVSRVIA